MLRFCSLIVLVCLITAGVSLAEFQINTYTDSEQITPAIAGDAQGNFVVVWASKYQDGDWRGIYGQRFDLYGIRTGDEFQINVITEGNQRDPDVAMNTTGNFVVVWQGEDGSDEGIYGRQYAADGTPLAGEFWVNTHTDSRQLDPKVAMNDNGAFVIVWESWYGFDAHNGEWQIRGRLYNAAGVAQGQEFIISQTPQAFGAHVAMNQTGEFIVVFSRDEDGNYGVHLSVRRYYANGTPKGNEEPLSEDIDGFAHPWISMDKAGNYVVAWTLNRANVYTQMFDSNNNAIGNRFLVNTNGSGKLWEPRISMNDDGQFVIAWWELANPDNVFGKFYHSGGIPDSNEFPLSDYTVGDQGYPAVLMQPAGRFIATWQSDGPDGSDEGIFAKFRPETFAGDFTGNGKVDFEDLAILASRWLQDEPVLDIVPPDGIGLNELLVLTKHWLEGVPIPSNLNLDLALDNPWMYQNLPGQTDSNLTATVSITDDPSDNSSYSYQWEIVLPSDVDIEPVSLSGGGSGDQSWTFAAPGCDEPTGISDLGETFQVRVTVTRNDYGNTGSAQFQFGIALVGDVNNDRLVDVADRVITNAFWRRGSAGRFTLADCDVNCDGVINVDDCDITNAIWGGTLGSNSIANPCPLR